MATQPVAPDQPAPASGLRIREIQTRVERIRGKDVIVPVLDADGKEIELFSLDIPQDVEAEGGAAVEACLVAARQGPTTLAAFYAVRAEARAAEIAAQALADAALLDELAPNPAPAARVAEGSPTASTFDEGAES